jgi:hypothetical protein
MPNSDSIAAQESPDTTVYSLLQVALDPVGVEAVDDGEVAVVDGAVDEDSSDLTHTARSASFTRSAYRLAVQLPSSHGFRTTSSATVSVKSLARVSQS